MLAAQTRRAKQKADQTKMYKSCVPFCLLLSSAFSDRWATAFGKAEAERGTSASELVPYWVFPHENGAVIERHVPALPFSRDADRLTQLRGALALYRMVFGQPRQDELVNYLLARLPKDAVDQIVRELRIDLEPPNDFQPEVTQDSAAPFELNDAGHQIKSNAAPA